MNKTGIITLMGTGSSMGVPMVGCECKVCLSSHPKNQRLRCSAYLQVEGKTFLIDCGPDFHQQGLKHRLKQLDGVIFTHSHFDHTAGLDELRLFNFKTKKPIPCLCSQATLKDLYQRFNYIFKAPGHKGNTTVQFDIQSFKKDRGEVNFLGLPFHYFTYSQGITEVNGYRFGDLAYVSDIKIYPGSIFEDLKGVKTLIVSALRDSPSHVHFTINEALAFAKKVGAQATYFIHMDHEVDYPTVHQRLPKGVDLAHDGLQLSFNL